MAHQNPTQSPGELIKAFLVKQNLTQADLAMVTQLSRQTLSNIISGRSNVTPETAITLAKAFGNEPSEWLKLDSEYRLALIQDDKPDVEHRSKIIKLAPLRDMQKRGWVATTDNFEDLENELKRFYETGDLHSNLAFNAVHRKSSHLPHSNKAVQAWCFRSRQIARGMPVGKFDEKNLIKLESDLRKVAAYAKEAYRVPKLLAKYGIRFVVNEHLPKTKIDGAAFWLDEQSPVIAISMRYDKLDYFWFTLMHEFKHIQHKDSLSIDDGLKENLETSNSETDLIEGRANKEAASSLIDQEELDSFIRRFSPLYSEQNIIQFANRIKIHPAIIVGQLQNRKEISFSTLRKLLPKVRDIVTQTALTDGWGKTLPASL